MSSSQVYLRVDPATSLAVEAFTPPDGKTPANCFVAALAATFVAASGGAAIGWTWANGAWSAPGSTPPTQAQLVAYATAKQIALRDGGITVNVGTAAAPVIVDVDSDVGGEARVAGNIQFIALCAQAGQPAPSFNWINDSVNGAPGVQITLSAAQMQTIGLDLRAFTQATYDALGTVGAAIVDGAITTYAGVDAASWPATAY